MPFMYHTNMIILREMKLRFHLIYIYSDYVTLSNTTKKGIWRIWIVPGLNSQIVLQFENDPYITYVEMDCSFVQNCLYEIGWTSLPIRFLLWSVYSRFLSSESNTCEVAFETDELCFLGMHICCHQRPNTTNVP